jgi:hypothetical protein
VASLIERHGPACTGADAVARTVGRLPEARIPQPIRSVRGALSGTSGAVQTEAGRKSELSNLFILCLQTGGYYIW